jgi:hypothetical protein
MRGLKCVALLLSLISISVFAEDIGKINVQYIQKGDVVDLKVPSVQGEFYNDMIPNTLDIADMANLAVNVLTSNTDPNADYETYERTYFLHNPPFMWHDFDNWFCSEWKYYESLSLIRLMTGSNMNRYIDDVWLKVLPDGLVS